MTEAGTSPSSPRKDLIQRDQCIFTSTTHIAALSAAKKKENSAYILWNLMQFANKRNNILIFLFFAQLLTLGKSINLTNSNKSDFI